MGGDEVPILVGMEPTLKYHPSASGLLTATLESGRGTVLGGQFDWGGRHLKGNGGAQRFPQAEWKPAIECKGIRELDCERDISNRYESRS